MTGVSQGSVLRPILFSMYTQCMYLLETSSGYIGLSHHLYVDDTQLYICHSVPQGSV